MDNCPCEIKNPADDSFFSSYDSPPLHVFLPNLAKDNLENVSCCSRKVHRGCSFSSSELAEFTRKAEIKCLSPTQPKPGSLKQKSKLKLNKKNEKITQNDIGHYFSENDKNASPVQLCQQNKRQDKNRKNLIDWDKEIGSFIDEYDMVPSSKRSNIQKERRFQPGPCRKMEDRKRIQGFDCACCKPYYDALELSPDSRKERVNTVSRHRAKVTPPKTPPGHWETFFPSTQDCLKRGLIRDSPYIPRQGISGKKLPL